MSNSGSHHLSPHVALLPSAGMGHLTPFLRLAASLVHHHCQVTLITIYPTVSLAESKLISRFLSAFPQVTEKQFHLLPLDPTSANTNDPFWLQWDATRRSVHLLSPLLSSLSPPLCVLVSDMSLISSVIPVTEKINILHYTLYTSSARMLSLFAYYGPFLSKTSPDFSQSSDVIEIPGVLSIPKSSIPPVLLAPKKFFASIFIEDGQKVTKLNGILINTFERLEPGSMDALNGGKVIAGLPPVFTIGLTPYEFERGGCDAPLKWLDDQLAESAVYVSFGSRTSMSREQIGEVGKGLIKSGYPFVWVVKDKKVDKEDKETLEEVLGDELMEKIKDKGLVVKEWVDQGDILGHRAVGGFVSHCGWNSVFEAAWHGVPLLAWPQIGDQKINAEVVEKSGLGLWAKNWEWPGEGVIEGEEIGKRIKEMMGSATLKLQAAEIKEEARKAVGAGGSCENSLNKVIEKWKNGGRV